jgi:hypothetical protein
MIAPYETAQRTMIWVPVCRDHFINWYAGIPEHERLPSYDLPESAHTIYQRIRKRKL